MERTNYDSSVVDTATKHITTRSQQQKETIEEMHEALEFTGFFGPISINRWVSLSTIGISLASASKSFFSSSHFRCSTKSSLISDSLSSVGLSLFSTLNTPFRRGFRGDQFHDVTPAEAPAAPDAVTRNHALFSKLIHRLEMYLEQRGDF
jgi:hypothetical protein